MRGHDLEGINELENDRLLIKCICGWRRSMHRSSTTGQTAERIAKAINEHEIEQLVHMVEEVCGADDEPMA